jgi:hypothetical protein
LRLYKPGTVPRGELVDTQRWLRTELSRLEQSIDSIREEFIRSIGYGALGQSSATSLGTLDATWQKLGIFDTVITTGLGVTLDTVNSTFTFTKPGLWNQDVNIILTHNLDNAAARVIELRYFDETTGQPATGARRITVNRSTTQTDIRIGGFFDVSPWIGEVISLQIRSLDGVTNVFSEFARIEFMLQTPYVLESEV